MTRAAALLARMQAPVAARDAVGDAELEEAWDRCADPEHLVWIAGAAAISLDETLRALSGALAETLVDVPEAEALVMKVLETAEACVRRAATRADCQERADEAERAAEDAPATFRDAPPKAYREVTRAAGQIARAAEAIMSARLRQEAGRMERARNAAAFLGVGLDVFARPETVARLDVDHLDHPVQAELLFVVASLANAARLMDTARGQLGGTRGAALTAELRESYGAL
jgi:hypothetical protein